MQLFHYLCDLHTEEENAGFTMFYCVVILYIVTFRRFHFALLIHHVHCRIELLISYSVVVGWGGLDPFVFVRGTAHCFSYW